MVDGAAHKQWARKFRFCETTCDKGNSDEEPQTDPTNNALPRWCLCNNCIQMPTPEENKCCRRRECITSYELFQNLCLDLHVLKLAVRARCNIRVEPHPVSATPLIGSSFCGNMVICGREIDKLYHPVLSKKCQVPRMPLRKREHPFCSCLVIHTCL